MKKIVVYATTEKGEGRVQQIGEYDDIEDIEIICGMFAKDIVITFEKKTKIMKNYYKIL